MGDLRQTATSLIKLSNYQLDTVINGLLHVNTSLEKNYQNVMSSPETLALSVGGGNLTPGASGDSSTNPSIINQTTGTFGSSSSLGSNGGNTTNNNNTTTTTTGGSFLIPNSGPTTQSRLNLFDGIKNIAQGANPNNNNNNNTGSGVGSQIPPETLHAIEEEVSERFIRSKIIIFQLFLKTLSAAIKYDRLDLRFDDDHLLMIEADSSNVDAGTGGLDATTTASDYSEPSSDQSGEPTVDDSGSTSDEELAPPAGFNESEITKLGNDYSETLLTQIIDTLFNIRSLSTSGGNVNTANNNSTDESTRTKGPHQYLKHLAARVLFKLSVVNFEVVFVRVEDFFKKMKSDEVDDRIYQMIEYINFDNAKLTRLISLLNEVQAKLKAKAFVALAGPLRQAVWNWITNYPHQFIRNCKNKTELPGGPQKLFNVIAERKLKKQAPFIWPLQTMILLLCPEVFANTIMAVKQGDKPKPSEKKEYKFLENILKALKEKNTKRDVNSDTAVVCFVDFYKASTYLKSRDLTAFRFLNSEVQNALHERLMNVDNPVRKNGTDDVDVKLMVDFFVSAYRINQRHVTSYIFPHCFKTKNTVFKLALAKAMLKLARKNSTSLKWHPTLAHSYKHIAKFVRNMFQELLQQESLLYNKRGQSVAQPSGSSSGSTTPPSTETLLACLAVFFAEPRLVLENTSDNISGHINEILYFFVGLVNCLEGVSNYQVQAQAYKLLQKLFQPHYIMQWCPQDIATGFIDLSSSVISRLCFILFQDKESQGQNVTTILELVKDVCTASNKFLSLHKDKITDQNLASRKRTQMWESAESTLLVLLCSTDPDIWTTAAGVFGDLCDMIDILENKETHNGIAQNYQLYRKISKLDELGKTRNHQQKSIRRLLRRVELQTKANLAAFIEMYSRWKDFTKTLEEGSIRNKELIDDARLVEHTRLKNLWKNYTAFLCSMGGVCLQSSETLLNPSNNPVPIKDQGSDDSTNDGSLSARGVRGGTTLKKEKKDFSMKDDLIRNLMRLVVSDVPLIRDNVAQTIGTELAPSLYGVLFQSLHSYVSGCFEEGASIVRVSSSSTLFVEKAIHIVRSVLEQAQENSEDLAMAKFETLILSFIRYCSQLVLNKDYNVIKCKLCILIDIMMKRKEYITFNNEIMFRFEALRHITEWTSEFVNKTAASSTTSVVELDFPNLDALCMKAISAVLKDLNFTKVRDKQSAGNGEKNDDMNKREFIKHFSFLSRYLTRSKVDKDAHPQLREYTILSLGNLLESNINYGLEQFMKMTYIEDQETRSAFLSVLTRVMKQGIQLEEEQNTESVKKYDKLLNLLIQDPNLDLVFLMVSSVSVNEMDDLCKALIRLFAERGKALELLKRSIDKEVDATSSSSTLFRANSSASKMLTAYCNSVGFKYIVDTLSELVKKVVSDPGNFEVDETKLKPNEAVEKNATLLAATAQAFLEHVFTSVDELPLQIRYLCNYLAESVNNKFPPVYDDEERHSTKHVVVGGLLFLRLLNPAIVSPKTSGLVDQSPTAEASRCLLLISKLLQNVANGIKFERKQSASDAKSFNKEAFMVKMDPFVAKNFDRARQFFDSVSSKCPDDFKEAEFIMEDEVREENFLCVHRFLFNNMEKMQQRLVQLQRSGQQSTQKMDTRKTIDDSDLSIISPVTDPKKLAESIERMQVIMTELGKPPEKEVKKTTMASASEEYSTPHLIQLISDNKDKDLSVIEERKIFYRSGASKEARPVFYFITQNLGSHFAESTGDKEDDKVMYHIFKTLMNFWTKPYEVVVDVTGLREETGLQAGHIVNFFKTLPTGARKNCARTIIFNPNSYLKTHLSQKFSYVKRKAIKKKVSFCISVRELEEYIERKNIDLPQSTLDYERDVESTFSSAFILSQRGEKKDAVVKVSKKYLCVITSDNILNHDTKRIDFIELLSISHATISTNAGNTEHVSVEYGSNNKLMIKAEKNDLLLMNIRNSIFRQKSEATLDDRVGRERAEGIRQQDIPGSLLNMCFLNLESKFPRTRSEAYNLLAALAEQFEFPVTLLETDIICVPHNTGDLVVALSEQVSKAKPLLTTQFLREALRGFNKVSLPYKYLVLKYMKPWIKNLSMIYAQANDSKQQPVQQMNSEMKGANYEMSIIGGSMMSNFEAQVQIDRTTEWFPDLVKSTIDFQDIYPAVLSEIWGELSKDGALVDIAMRCIISAAHEAGPKMSKKVDILNDLVVTLASGGHAPAVVKMIVDQLLDVMDNEIHEVVEPLEEHPGWAKVIIYSRFLLMLSFQNRISVLDNFPTLFYIISMMIGRGSMFLRATIRGFAINVVHSLSTSLDFTNEHKKIMQQHLNTLVSDKFQFMFMGTDGARDMDPFVSFENDGTTPAKKEKPFKISPINMWDLETLAHYFYEVTKTCYLVDPEIQKRWHKELTQMCHSKALKTNPVFLPRLLAMYGVLIKPGEETQETLPFVVERLIDSFSANNEHTAAFRTDYKIATLLCLGQYSYKLSPDEPILKQVFAIPIVLLALSDESLFPAVVHLFDCVLNAVGASPQFQKCISIEEYFNSYCRVSGSLIDNVITKVEVSIGVSFRTHFSFALSCLLMRGLTNAQTKSTTANICANLITLSARLQHNRMLMLGEEEDGLSSIDQPQLQSSSQSDLSTASSPVSMEGSSLPSTPKIISESSIKFYYSILGFIALLIPSDFEKLCQILGGKVFFNDKTFSSSSFTPLLFTRFLITAVQHVDMDTERIAIYSALQEAFHKLPSVFISVYPDILPHMINVYNKANITRIAEVSLTLIDTIMQQTEEKSFKPKTPVNYDDTLSKSGFGGLGKLGSFKIATDKIKHDVGLLLVDYLKEISKK
ncbi:rasGTPase-activating protein [Naegleria gruberi]|uniref:RasGTPase-activating protein n=1 Tax=Naegleria gruberi TaxID=5762 RepID=D2VR60_NAEGR|nr:rasGTPase-activating protein [Naegleria gruberi]EFC40840.1 rasGTPase-activating protein [Naegleria gruberi]|eukprot:XP_002673584.1 rasGTPase-activating protein [Naegleria gruberi strain NEG-M]